MAGIVIIVVENTGSGEIYEAPKEVKADIIELAELRSITSPHELLGKVKEALERARTKKPRDSRNR